MSHLNGLKLVRSQELLHSVCKLIQDGFSLRFASSELGFPTSSFCDWISEDEIARDQYTRARQIQADKYADEIVEMSDSAIGKPAEIVTAIRNAVDARKWTAAKLRPKVYGDRPAEVNVNTTNNFLVVSEARQKEIQERTHKLLTEK